MAKTEKGCGNEVNNNQPIVTISLQQTVTINLSIVIQRFNCLTKEQNLKLQFKFVLNIQR